MAETLNLETNLFYDPFAEDGNETFDPLTAHASLWERYKNQEVEHDYTADKFLVDTQSLMMDSQFLGLYAQAEMLAARMHMMCGEDHGLAQSLQANESAKNYLDSFNSGHDGHDHNGLTHDNAESDKTKDGKKKKIVRWLGRLFTRLVAKK